MQNHEGFHWFREEPPYANQTRNSYMHNPFASSFATDLPPASAQIPPVYGVEFQPSEVCPKNFIIFDQTDQRSQIMYHPAIAHKFGGPNLNIQSSYIQENFDNKDGDDLDRNVKEDSDDINALLSFDKEIQEEYDDEDVSTARTYGNCGSNSPDSCCSHSFKPGKNSSFGESSGGSNSSTSERKRKKMKKMVMALRHIVPGGDQMDTATVLDEAVTYLKSLKLDVKKLGFQDFRN